MTDMYDDKDLQRLYNEKYFLGRESSIMWKRRAEYISEKFKPKTALDIGCATGNLVKYLNKLDIDAYGIDGADYAVTHADPAIKNKIFKVNLNSDQFPFDDNSFDFVGSFYSTEHIHNIEFFAKELYRTLKSNGIAWFLTPNEGEEGRNVTDVFTNKFEDWKKIYEKYNFKVEKFSPHEMLTLRGKLGKFNFYKLPIPLQNIVKRIAYDIVNARSMKDTSFILQKI